MGSLGSIKAMMVVALLMMSGMFFNEFIGELEGRVFPVVVDVAVERERQRGTMDPGVNWTKIDGVFTKVRDCSFLSAHAEVRVGRLSVSVPISFGEATKLRGDGIHEFGPWFVRVLAADFETTVIRVVHQCRYRPWTTITQFFP